MAEAEAGLIIPVGFTERAAAQAAARIEAQAIKAAKASEQAFVKANANIVKSTGAMSGQMRGQIQNVSYQLQDVFVQIAGGTSATRALSQQLPQLLGGFGALGAVLGTVAAVGIPLAAMFVKAGEDAEGLKKQIEDLDKALSAYSGAIDRALAPMDDLWAKFGEGAEAAKATYGALLEIERIEYLKGMKAGVTAVSEQLTALTDALSRYQGAVNSSDGLGEAKALAVQSALNELQKYFGLSAQEADKVNQALQNMAAARDQGPAAAAQAAKQLGDALMVAYDQGGRTNDALLDGATRAYDLQLNAAEAAGVMGDGADGAANAADGTITAADAAEAARVATENWAAAMSGVRAEIGAIASALASMGGGMIANASKFVELNALKQGKSVAEAAQARQKAQMEADFAAREMAAGTWVEKMVLKGEKALAERGLALDGELEAARSEARKAEQAAAKATGGGRKRSGGGGGARATKEPVNILESADREIQQLERQIELLGKSNQEVATAEARWSMLDAAKKAGIPVNDTLNAQIDAQAAQVGNLTAQLEQAELAQEQFDQAIEGIANAFSNAILEGENLRDSLASIFKQIAANILNAGIQQALTQAFSGAGGGGGGWFSGLLSAAFGGTKAAVPSYDGGGFTGYGSRSGGVDGKGGELAILHPNETVLDHTRGQHAGGGGGSYAMTIDLRGTTGDRELDAKMARAGQASLAQVPATMRSHQMRRG